MFSALCNIYHYIEFSLNVQVYPEGTHLMIPWFERPVIYDVRARPNLVESTTGSHDLQMVNTFFLIFLVGNCFNLFFLVMYSKDVLAYNIETLVDKFLT